MPLRMEIGLRAFMQIADMLQMQKENGPSPPSIPTTFSIPNTDVLSVYLISSNPNVNEMNSANGGHLGSSGLSANMAKQRSSSVIQQGGDMHVNQPFSSQRAVLTDVLVRELGLASYFEHVRRAFQDILKTLDATIGRSYLMTRVENSPQSTMGTNSTNVNNLFDSQQSQQSQQSNDVQQSDQNGGAGLSLLNSNMNDHSLNGNGLNEPSQLNGNGIGSDVLNSGDATTR